MSFWDDLTGKSSIKANNAASVQAQGYLTQGRDDATKNINDSATQAQGYWSPYAQSGQAANTLYSNAIGLNGRPAQQGVMDTYASSDPFRQFNETNANNALFRGYNARGMMDSGASRLATARASLERGSQDWNGWLNRLQGQQGQGVQVAGQQAGIAQNTGQQLAGINQGYYQNLANNTLGVNAANNQALMGGVYNLLQGAGTLFGSAISAFAPGVGGASAAGNMAKMFGGGGGSPYGSYGAPNTMGSQGMGWGVS